MKVRPYELERDRSIVRKWIKASVSGDQGEIARNKLETFDCGPDEYVDIAVAEDDDGVVVGVIGICVDWHDAFLSDTYPDMRSLDMEIVFMAVSPDVTDREDRCWLGAVMLNEMFKKTSRRWRKRGYVPEAVLAYTNKTYVPFLGTVFGLCFPEDTTVCRFGVNVYGKVISEAYTVGADIRPKDYRPPKL